MTNDDNIETWAKISDGQISVIVITLVCDTYAIKM